MRTDPFFAQGKALMRARMMTGSMFPLVVPGTVMVFAATQDIRPGDLAVFGQEGRWFCHRVITVSRDTVTTWGDWSLIPDSPHPREAISGRCLFLVRKGVVVDLDWPLLRLSGYLAARFLPRIKERLFPRR